jgi:hypothetical protein
MNMVAGCKWLRLRTLVDFDVNCVESSGFVTKRSVSYLLNAECEMRNNLLLTAACKRDVR